MWSSYPESLVPIVLGIVQSARNFGHWNILGVGFLRVFMALYGYSLHWHDISKLILSNYLHKGYRYELRPAIPLQPSEQKWKIDLIYCIAYYYSEAVEFYTRFWNYISQLIQWNYLRKGHRYELRPAILVQLSETKMKKQFELLLGNCWVLHKVLKWYLRAHPVDLSSQGA